MGMSELGYIAGWEKLKNRKATKIERAYLAKHGATMTKAEALEVLDKQIDAHMAIGAVVFFKNGETYVGFDLINEFTIVEAAKVAMQPNKALEGIV